MVANPDILYLIAAYQLCWFSGLTGFLSSVQQSLFQQPLNKLFGQSACVLLAVTSFLFFLPVYHWLTALLIVIAGMMTAWISLALIVPYLPRPTVIVTAGSAIALLIAVTGNHHVV